MTTGDTLYQAARIAIEQVTGGPLSPAEDELLRTTAGTSGNTLTPIFNAMLLQKALEKHADALVQAAAASEKYAANLARATWALVAATALLAVGTLITLFQ